MKLSFLKTAGTDDDFYGVSMISENPTEKQLIKKMTRAKYAFKTSEKSIANLPVKQITITIEISNPV